MSRFATILMPGFSATLAILVALPMFGALNACTSMQPGAEPGPVPPRLNSRREGEMTWDNPGAFGAVPARLQATGDATCVDFGFSHTDGYHPGALDEDGTPFDGGGFFCHGEGPKPGSAPSAVPPRLVQGPVTLRWDNPEAFGPVPAANQAQGDRICQSMGYKRALGFHSGALDAKGKPFASGAYFCTKHVD
jgi:hypothetical protein